MSGRGAASVLFLPQSRTHMLVLTFSFTISPTVPVKVTFTDISAVTFTNNSCAAERSPAGGRATPQWGYAHVVQVPETATDARR
jgi:hypothetical protein